MNRIVECIPNFSEGRDPGKVRALVEAATQVHGVYVLDQEMDADHHRSVLTFAGPPEAVAEAAFRCARLACDLIDLRHHHGAHPRIGATDVIPFVPLQGVSMEECVEVATRLGARIGRTLGIPVFLYERAASHPDRTNLEAIRRGGLEGLAARMMAEEAWKPDFGPRALHASAGATVVGARPALIAYNVNLRSSDVAAAKAIAKTVRFSSGGLPFVKAIGVDLSSRGLVQVSMNLTNFEATPIQTVFDAVHVEAQRRGIEVEESEIVGLVPQRALIATAEQALKLVHFDPGQVLETRLTQALSVRPSASPPSHAGGDVGSLATAVTGFLSAVAAGSPTPGGGSVAALAGALAASLGIMACRLGPPKAKGQTSPEESLAALRSAERTLVAHATRLQALIQADAQAYDDVLQAYRRPKDDPERAEAVTDTLLRASEVPMDTAELAHASARLLLDLRRHVKPSVGSDIRVGLFMAVAAMEGGLENVRQNLKAIENETVREDLTGRLKAMEQSLEELRPLC